MKRNFEEMKEPAKDSQAGQSQQNGNEADPLLYGPSFKRRKLDDQLIGDFIVKAFNAVHFKIVANESQINQDSSNFFAPKFLHVFFGEKEEIRGYEGLQIVIYLSYKRWIPLIEITYDKKAPAFAAIDDLNEIFTKHFGSFYTDKQKFASEVLVQEQTIERMGTPFDKIYDKGFPVYDVRHVCCDDESFNEQNVRIQNILPFFIDGASAIEPNGYWHYFLTYQEHTGQLVCIFTLFHAHQTMDRFRAKISQILVPAPFQRKGLSSKIYLMLYNHYRLKQQDCFQIVIEDPVEEITKMTDFVHTRVLAQFLAGKETSQQISLEPIFAPEQIERISSERVRQLSADLKLPYHVIIRLCDLYTFVRIKKANQHYEIEKKDPQGKAEKVMSAFRLSVKRRLYVRCVKLYPELFKDKEKGGAKGKGGLAEPYIWNDLLEEDQFFQTSNDPNGQQAANGGSDPMAALTFEATKMQLETMYKGMVSVFTELLPKLLKELK